MVMEQEQSELVAVGDLRVGMFIELGVGWMAHPFPTGSFRIASARQIETIRALGLAQVRHYPLRSDQALRLGARPAVALPSREVGAPRAAASVAPAPPAAAMAHAPAQSAELARERQRQARCERRFQESAVQYKNVMELAAEQPRQARARCEAQLAGLLEDVLRPGDISIRLLSGNGGARAGAHATNVTVLALLLGKALGLSGAELQQLGTAAYLHDIGKGVLPERVRSFDEYFSVAEYRMYQEHVAAGVEIGRAMGLEREILLAIGQHHELLDGSGFPRKSRGETLGRLGRILAVVNRFDNLCNPAHPGAAQTPHEALSTLYGQTQGRHDTVVVSALIRMLGVYPPGTVVQLSNETFGLVLMANTARSLQPCVLVHDPRVPRHEAVPLDLENTPGLVIRRGIRPANLSLESADYLMPRQRICYFMDRPEQRLAA